jgi:hypothetical protein
MSDPLFAMVDLRLLRHGERLGITQGQALYLSLVQAFDYDDKGHSYRGQDAYAALLGVSTKTVSRWTEHLRGLGLIEVRRRPGPGGRGRANEISWDGLHEALDALEPTDTLVSDGDDWPEDTQMSIGENTPTDIWDLTNGHFEPARTDTQMSAEVEELEAEEGRSRSRARPALGDHLRLVDGTNSGDEEEPLSPAERRQVAEMEQRLLPSRRRAAAGVGDDRSVRWGSITKRPGGVGAPRAMAQQENP